MILKRLKKWLHALPLLGACHPILAPTPMQLGETAPALQEGEVSITGQGGAVSAGLLGIGPRVRLFIEAGLGAVETGSQSETLVYGSGGIAIVTGP